MNRPVISPSRPPRIIIPDVAMLPRPYPDAEKLVLEGKAFATTWRVILFATGDVASLAGPLHGRCQAWLDRIDAEMSPFRADSDLTRFNTARGGDFIDLPPLFMRLIAYALEIAEFTSGAFDPTLLSAVELWGFGARTVSEGLPDPAEVAALQDGQARWRDLLAHHPAEITSGLVKPDGLRLDFCAIAKGFAVDGLVDLLKVEPGVCAALVEVGGELKGWGGQADGLPFWVEVESDSPTDRTLIALCDWAVATSGDRRRFFEHDGRLFSHTIDATTGTPTHSNIASATVFDKACWRADALATALIVMGESAAAAFAEAHDIPCLLSIRCAEGLREYVSPALERWL